MVMTTDWPAQRNAAQLILGAYDKSVVEMLPSMVRHLIRQMPVGTARNEFIFILAQQLDVLIAGKVDPISNESNVFPMGRDTVLAAFAANSLEKPKIDAENDLCAKAELVLDDLAENRVLKKRMVTLSASTQTKVPYDAIVIPGTEFHPNLFRQIVFPMVFGAKNPITARDVQTVNEHFPAREDRCMKLINSFSVTYGSSQMTALALNPSVSMDLDIFHERLETVATSTPGLLLRALCELGYMGPRFFSGKAFLPDRFPYPFGEKSLPLAFAEWYQTHVEQVPLQKLTV